MILLEEQGLRDGFQNLEKTIPTDMKLRLIDQLIEAGIRRIQVASFVHPKWVPQMADADQLCQQLNKREGIIYSGLVLNLKGVERGLSVGLDHLACSISASDTHSQKNARKTLVEAKTAFREMVRTSQAAGARVRGGIQCAFGCRYEGKVAEEHVLDMVKHHLDQGIDEIALADSTGMANPRQMRRLMEQVVALAEGKLVILHLHNTENKGLANVYAALEAGVHCFDTAFGGLGGCPFIKSATGNIATEDTAHLLHQMEYETGIDIGKLTQISKELEAFLGYELQGQLYKLWGNPDIKIV